jgi:hypothetical protein
MSCVAFDSALSALERFPADERRLLLSLPRIGPTVVARIEAQGIASLRDLRRRGVEHLVDEVCRQMGTRAWANRRSALTGALDAMVRVVSAAEKTGTPAASNFAEPPQPLVAASLADCCGPVCVEAH